MELNINSPAYFSEHYGIDDEVYRFCQKANLFFQDKEYSNSIKIIGIMPIAAPKEVYDNGLWKESVRIIGKECASITIRMDFDKYYKADSHGKILQIRETVLKAVKKIKTRSSFNYKQFEEDFLSISIR